MHTTIFELTISVVMTGMALAGCGGSGAGSQSDGPTLSQEEADENLDYEYGEGKTFYSEEPMTYSMMYSDHENYPYQEDWLLWKAIEEKTNVTFDLTTVARTDYNDKVSASVNSGSAPYIIPKVYDSAAYEDSGQVVPISDWVQYMPNYQNCVKEWGLEDDLKQIMAADGKYYRLPGMWETAAGGYSLAIRKDVFEVAGVDLSKEATWTWEDFYEALKKVKDYTGKDYVWSDGFGFGSTMNIAATVYGVTGGYSTDGGDWGLKDGVKFDFDKDEFYFADTTEEYKEYLSVFAKMYEEVFEGLNYTNEEIAEMFNKTFALDKHADKECATDGGASDMVVVKDIDIFSYCEHHLALMYDMKVTVAYIPKDRVIGLSKIARIADMVSKRLQLQERIGSDIADIIHMVTGTDDVAVLIEGCHSCMTARGIRKADTKTYTQTLRGRFQNESNGFMQWWR